MLIKLGSGSAVSAVCAYFISLSKMILEKKKLDLRQHVFKQKSLLVKDNLCDILSRFYFKFSIFLKNIVLLLDYIFLATFLCDYFF